MTNVKKVKLSKAQKEVIKAMRNAKTFRAKSPPYRSYTVEENGNTAIINKSTMDSLYNGGVVELSDYDFYRKIYTLTTLGKSITLND